MSATASSTLSPLIERMKAASQNQAARTAALRQLVLQAPAPVVAQALGYHPITTRWHRADAGGTWTHYAPGDHAGPSPTPPVIT